MYRLNDSHRFGTWMNKCFSYKEDTFKNMCNKVTYEEAKSMIDKHHEFMTIETGFEKDSLPHNRNGFLCGFYDADKKIFKMIEKYKNNLYVRKDLFIEYYVIFE